ncbi:ferredoxin [Candidatus Kuenenbacteria bacterium CG11_big_fil_rev_8_21_14_0_20_37_9]|uniref:Ferredoxin n=2 Tax=Candidatus Kueneniibacteriota TaxID=1752740 RepID=A0A2M6XRY4_9BACT|nr:MAG: hypothetical protein AUJ29_01085 [Candidatus Kuenenbacteria bacterium CG1_02_38_13]PIR05447.1 MAG: ferredoxin [Candidatus Kuenenbacteria bacterium CG11_big_fil_rev_8_21_14_0_20_37_9]PIU10390.1 MAG: ferredoxin [Candidatus Kuenenbacteria bacterium CG08_land_8_20_14_0_20_37_23]
MPKIIIDNNKCIACGSCYAMYPEVFEAGNDGKCYVKDHDHKKYNYSKNEIINTCPVGAIDIED